MLPEVGGGGWWSSSPVAVGARAEWCGAKAIPRDIVTVSNLSIIHQAIITAMTTLYRVIGKHEQPTAPTCIVFIKLVVDWTFLSFHALPQIYDPDHNMQLLPVMLFGL